MEMPGIELGAAGSEARPPSTTKKFDVTIKSQNWLNQNKINVWNFQRSTKKLENRNYFFSVERFINFLLNLENDFSSIGISKVDQRRRRLRRQQQQRHWGLSSFKCARAFRSIGAFVEICGDKKLRWIMDGDFFYQIGPRHWKLRLKLTDLLQILRPAKQL